MIGPAQAVIGSLLACLAGAILTLAASRRRALAGWLAFLVTLISSLLALYAAGAALLSAPAGPATFLEFPRLGFALRVYVDGLSAVFIGLIASIALPAAFYSIRYLEHYRSYGVARYYPNFLLFLAAMYGLVSTTDMMWFFFIFWQMMTLPGYALIRFEHRERANVRAANKYLLMMQVACALTMIGAVLLAGGGPAPGAAGPRLKYDFDSIGAALPWLLEHRGTRVAVAFVLFLAGFGIKMGMWPFGQVWLPDAHPAAPSPVSAMLSGVMIKTGVYGVMRYFLWLVPAEAQGQFPMARWGTAIALLGTVTLFTGTAQALKQEQTKRLLAFHSIGQIGYILLGLGIALVLLPAPDWGRIALAALAFMGALFHTLNHGLFKSLLFLNAGSMLHATGTQDLNRLGGLMRHMPLTALTALVASFSISGVPLFNGFVSKWAIFAAAIQGGAQAWFLPVCGLVAILTSALTLGSFIKFFGASFLSRTSAAVAERAAAGRLEVGWTMQAPQVALAALCVALGLFPAAAFKVLTLAMDHSRQGLGAILAHSGPVTWGPGQGVAALEGHARFAPLVVALALALAFLAAWALTRAGRASRRATVPWLCGYAREAEVHRYGAHGFYFEFKRLLGWVGGAGRAAPPPPQPPAPASAPPPPSV